MCFLHLLSRWRFVVVVVVLFLWFFIFSSFAFIYLNFGAFMCGVRTEAQIVKFWKASETSPHDWFFISKTFNSSSKWIILYILWWRKAQTAALLWIICIETGGKWREKDENFSNKRNAINMNIFFNSPEIVFLRSIAQKIQENSFHQIYFFPNFHNLIFIL